MAKVNGFHQCCNHANKCIFPRMLSHVCYYFAYSSMNWPTFCINCLLYILHNSIWVIGHIISKPNFVLISLLIFSSLWTVPYMIDTFNTNVWANHANRFYIANDLKPSIKELPYVLCILSVWHLKNYTRSAVIARQQGPQSSYTFLTV